MEQTSDEYAGLKNLLLLKAFLSENGEGLSSIF